MCSKVCGLCLYLRVVVSFSTVRNVGRVYFLVLLEEHDGFIDGNVIHISISHGCRSFRCVIAAWQGVRHVLYIPVVVKLSCHLETYDVTYLNSICFLSDICTSMRHFSMGNKVAIYPRRPVTNASLG